MWEGDPAMEMMVRTGKEVTHWIPGRVRGELFRADCRTL
jgi:hypothetical protein